MDAPDQLGFPVPLLGMQPLRLPILFDDGELLALAKPQQVLVQADSWYPRLPVLIEAIRHQAQRRKPEFVRRGIGPDGLWAVTDLDPELYGPVLFARTRERAEELRNRMGSDGLVFRFVFLSRRTAAAARLDCELPLARHSRLPRMLVSHTTGKKARTVFNRIAAAGAFTCWQAETSFPRRHQILLHAAEAGLPVIGDPLYAQDKPVYLSAIKHGYAPKADQDERPLFDGPACFLHELELAGTGCGPVRCPEPPRWSGLIKQLHKHASA